jgi:hypothetical protein
MIRIQLKNVADFERIAKGQKTVYVKKGADGFTYYVVSDHAGIGVINVFKSEKSLKFNEGFNPEEQSAINVKFLIEIEGISPFYAEGFYDG